MPSARPKLLIHIGSPKAGSTALQDFLFHRRDDLAALGFCLPDGDLYQGRGNEKFRLSLNIRERPETQAARAFYAGYFNAALKTGTPCFLSAETLWSADPARLLAVYPMLSGMDVTIFAVLRRQSEMIPAHYKQHVKSGGIETLPDFIARRRASYQYRSLIARWRSVFPVRLFSYDEVRRPENGIVRTLMAAAASYLPPPARTEMAALIQRYQAKGVKMANRTIWDAQAHALYAINLLPHLDAPDKAALRHAVLRSRDQFSQAPVDTPFISGEGRDLIMALEQDDLDFDRPESWDEGIAAESAARVLKRAV